MKKYEKTYGKEGAKVRNRIFNSEYQPDQTLSDYSPEQLTESSAIEGYQPLKYSVVGNRAETFEAPRKKTDFSDLPIQYKTNRMNSAICISKPDDSGDSLCGKAQFAMYCGTSVGKEISCAKCKSLFTKMTDEEKEKVRVYGFGAETFEADSKEKARLKKYEKTYGKEGAKVRNRIFKRILAKAQDGTKAGQWSARKAQSLAEDYEKAMSKKGKKPYKSSKKTKSQKSLKDWGDQDWKTKSGKKSSKTGERYLPAKAIDSLTDEEYKKTSAKKRKDMKKGKQFSDQPKKIADKVAKYRAEFTDNCEFCPNDVKVISDDDGYACVDCGALTCYGCGSGDGEKYPYCPSCLEKFESESSKPHSVTISRSSNSEKKLMAVFEDSEGKKIKTTHFGQRGASDYTKHGEKERMERYLERHGGGFETSTKENWKDPTTAGALSRWILWNKPSLKASFDDYKSRFGLKGSIKVSKSAENVKEAQYQIGPTAIYDLHEKFEPYGRVETTFGNYATKVMMTPKQFISLCYQPLREDRNQEKLIKYRESFEKGIPLHTPVLQVKKHEHGWEVIGHEGRHRVQSLIDMGYGDVKIPVSMWPRGYMGDPYSTRGNNEQVNEAFKDVMIFPESEGEGNDLVFVYGEDVDSSYQTGKIVKLDAEGLETKNYLHIFKGGRFPRVGSISGFYSPYDDANKNYPQKEIIDLGSDRAVLKEQFKESPKKLMFWKKGNRPKMNERGEMDFRYNNMTESAFFEMITKKKSAETFEATEWVGFCPECNKWRTKDMSLLFKNNTNRSDEEYIADLSFNGWSVPKKLLNKRLCGKSKQYGDIQRTTDSWSGYGQRTYSNSVCGTPLKKVKSKYKAEERKCKSCEKPATNVVQEGSFCYDCLPINLGAEHEAKFPILQFAGSVLLVSLLPLFLDNRRDKV